MSLTVHNHYDVVIVGAGMVGASLACALTHGSGFEGLKLLLVEASPVLASSPVQQPGFDARSTVLSAGTMAYFSQLGLDQELLSAAAPITEIHVSDQGRIGGVHLDSKQQGVSALGHVIENINLGQTLNQALLRAANLELCAPVQVTAIKPCIEGMQLLLAKVTGNNTITGITQAINSPENKEITASLVVLAEGGRSSLCANLGIEHYSHNYNQSALIANVAFTKPHASCAYERFTPKGPLALLPLEDREGVHRAALVWTHSSVDVSEIMAMKDEALLQQLQQDFGKKLGTFTRIGKRSMYPLALQLAHEQIRPALVLLGNVAHSLHPVAGQGFNLAMRDTMALAFNIRESLQQNVSPGSFTRLQCYLQAVQQDQQHTISFSDYMTRLFSSTNWLSTWTRTFGMASIDLLPPLKRQLNRQAMGLAQSRISLS